MNLYFTLFLAPIWPISSPVFSFYRVKEGSNRPPLCILFTYAASFDIFRNSIEEEERWIISGRRRCQRREKSREKASHGSPEQSSTRGTTGEQRPSQTKTAPHGTVWPCHVARPCHMARCGRATWRWHGPARLFSLAHQCFGTVGPCLWARPCHPRSASRLKSSPGAVSGGFSLAPFFSSQTWVLGDS